MQSTVIGGAMLPHAPQFFTLPDTEDKAVVAKVREVAADIGKRLRALKPDLWIIFSNDHVEQFFHTTCPPFTVHVGGEATGRLRRPQIPLAGAERDRLRAGAPALPAEFRPGLLLDRQDRLRHRHSADPYRPHRPGAADLRERLPAAAADDGALLPVRPGGGAHRDADGAAHRHPGERRHVAFPRHRPLLQSGAELGQERARQARGRKPEIADRLRRGRARRDRQYRAALLGLRRRRARRAQARRRLDGPELAPRLRLARLDRRQDRRARRALSLDQAGAGRADRRAARARARRRQAHAICRRRAGLSPTSSSCRRISARR